MLSGVVFLNVKNHHSRGSARVSVKWHEELAIKLKRKEDFPRELNILAVKNCISNMKICREFRFK
jgi:hypothetical protein